MKKINFSFREKKQKVYPRLVLKLPTVGLSGHRYYTIVVSITSIYYDWLSILPLPRVSVIAN